MRRDQQCFLRLGISILAVLALSFPSIGQAPPDSAAGPITTDWSNHHLIFSRPATAEQSDRVQKDPRYQQQLLRRSMRLPEAEVGGGASSEPRLDSNAPLAGINSVLNGDWSQDMGSGATVGAINYPAKYTFKTNSASCANDFVVYGTGLAGGLGQASIVGYNNIYSGCGGTVPSVYWAYDTGGTAVTSPIFSRDGTQVAFVQKGGGYKSTFVILKWVASTIETITSPLMITNIYHGSYPLCPAPCETELQLRDGSGAVDMDSNSSIFYDFSNDVAYVGDDDGWLHKYAPVFNGKPDEVRDGIWPIQVNPATPTALTGPVHDYASGNVFVADTGGFLYLVNSSGVVTVSGQLDFSVEFDTNGPGIVQGPIVDSTAGFVYVFVTSDGRQNCSVSFADCTAVFQLTTSFAAGDTGSEAVVGDSTIEPATPNPLYLGAFDSTYENSVNATGHLYVCGNTGGPPILYQVPIGAGVLGAPIAAPVLSNDTTPCSPVTDVFNPNVSGGATEWIFASTQAGGVSAGCSAGGCIFNFKDTPWLPLNAYSVGQEVLDSSLHIEVVETAGTSGSTAPLIWNGTTGGSTTDGSVHWLDQGAVSAFTPAAWIANHSYTDGTEILDGNGNIELVTKSSHGKSGATPPTFNLTPGGTTTDNTITWTNVGAIATAATAEAGGTSGMIIDNTVSSGTQPGASNIYFSTLGDQPCGTSGTGGCAIQASQAALQ